MAENHFWFSKMKEQIILITFPVALLWVALTGTGCYSFRPSSGGGQATFDFPREINPADVAVPGGYRVDAVARGLTFPTGVAFDNENGIYVVESGYSYGEVWTAPRLLRIHPDGATSTIATGGRNGPWNGVAYADGSFYVAEGGVLEGGRILQITPGGEIRVLVDGLPSHGDHHTNGPIIGPDGALYFGQGVASNSGVIGEDNAQFGWLHRFPRFHDVPGEDIVLTGLNFKTKNPLSKNPAAEAWTGAFSPFGETTAPGQIIRGQIPCSGSILRLRPGAELEMVAWGFRNPFGLAFSPEGRLFVTDNGYDDRGSRPVWGSPDVLWEVVPGLWYGWPDFAAGIPIRNLKPPGKSAPEFLLAEHPNDPPEPRARFSVHSSANGFDFSRGPRFGYEGEAFVALLGDESPVTGKLLHPSGFKVVRVNVDTGVIEDFAVNKGRRNGPASKIGGGGLERPVAARFTPNGEALYVVDFGVLTHGKNQTVPHKGTGVLWRIRRETEP